MVLTQLKALNIDTHWLSASSDYNLKIFDPQNLALDLPKKATCMHMQADAQNFRITEICGHNINKNIHFNCRILQ